MNARFLNKSYRLIFTEHALIQMSLRDLDQEAIKNVIETGKRKSKEKKRKYWVFKELKGRADNLISVSISIESPNLIVITTMVNWRP